MPDKPRTHTSDLAEVITRNSLARHLTEGLTTQYPDIWHYLQTAFADTPALAAEVIRLRADLAGARLDRANLAAAARATIAAHHDGEPDPLSYLRDELHTQGFGTELGQA